MSSTPPEKCPVKLTVSPQQLLADLQYLAGFGRVGNGLSRALTDINLDARRWLVSRTQAATPAAEIDGVGNLVGSLTDMVLDDYTVPIPSGPVRDPLVAVLEARGFDVPKLPNATVRAFGGSLRCAYQPLVRY